MDAANKDQARASSDAGGLPFARHLLASAGILAIAILSVSLVATRGGSGASGSPQGKIKLTIAVGAGGAYRRALETALADFEEAHPEISLQMIYIGGMYYDKIEVMIAGKRAPDVMWMGQGFAMFATRDAFLPIDDLFKDVDRAEYFEEVLDWYKFKGRFYGFPYSVDLCFIAYNKDLFDDAGVPYPDGSWTVEEFIETAQKLTLDTDRDGHIDQYGYVGSIEIGTFGDRLLSEDNTRCVLDTPEAARLAQLRIDLEKKYKISPPPDSDVRALSKNMSFEMGRVAMMESFTWETLELRRKVNTFEWDITLMPIGTQRAHWASSGGFAVSRTTKHPKEAIELLKYTTRPKFVTALQGETLPVERAVAEEMAAEWEGPPEHFPLMIEMTKYMHPTPRVPNINEINTIYWDYVGRARLEKMTMTEALQKAAEEINELLARERRVQEGSVQDDP